MVMEILVFKTNVRNKKHVLNVGKQLNSIADISRWNFDLDDTDKILRIEAHDLSPRIIESALQNAGYYCKELED